MFHSERQILKWDGAINSDLAQNPCESPPDPIQFTSSMSGAFSELYISLMQSSIHSCFVKQSCSHSGIFILLLFAVAFYHRLANALCKSQRRGLNKSIVILHPQQRVKWKGFCEPQIRLAFFSPPGTIRISQSIWHLFVFNPILFPSSSGSRLKIRMHFAISRREKKQCQVQSLLWFTFAPQFVKCNKALLLFIGHSAAE